MLTHLAAVRHLRHRSRRRRAAGGTWTGPWSSPHIPTKQSNSLLWFNVCYIKLQFKCVHVALKTLLFFFPRRNFHRYCLPFLLLTIPWAKEREGKVASRIGHNVQPGESLLHVPSGPGWHSCSRRRACSASSPPRLTRLPPSTNIIKLTLPVS